MRKFAYFLIASLVFFSCTQEEQGFEENNPSANGISTPALERCDTVIVVDPYFESLNSLVTKRKDWAQCFAKEKSLVNIVEDDEMTLYYGVYHNWDELLDEDEKCSMHIWGAATQIDSPVFNYRNLDVSNSTIVLLLSQCRSTYDVESIEIEKEKDGNCSMNIKCGKCFGSYGDIYELMLFILPDKIDAKKLNVAYNIKEEYVQGSWTPIIKW